MNSLDYLEVSVGGETFRCQLDILKLPQEQFLTVLTRACYLAGLAILDQLAKKDEH